MRSVDWFTERFGLAEPVALHGPVDQGHQGRIWRLDCAGAAYAAKETFVPLADEQAWLAYEFQRRAAEVGVVVPRQLLTVDGRPAVHDDGETLRLYEWLELGPPDRGLDATAVGRLLADLHGAGGPASGDVDPWYWAPVGRDRWVELLAELELAGAPFAADLHRQLPELLASESIMEPPDQTVLCHRDLWSDNVRPGLTGPVVIDWDNCGPATPSGEIAMVLLDFGATPERIAAIYRAYRDAGGPGRLREPSDFTMLLAVLHHLVELGARQWLAASGDQARQRAEGRVREFLDDPTDLAEISAMLRSCE